MRRAIATPADPVSTRTESDSLLSPTFIIAVLLILYAGGTTFGLFLKGSTEVISTVSNGVVMGIIGFVGGYFFSASKHGNIGTTTPAKTETKAP